MFCQRGGHGSRDRIQTLLVSNTFAGVLLPPAPVWNDCLCNYFWTWILGAGTEQVNGEWGHFLSLLPPTFLCAGAGPCSCAVIIQADTALWNKAGTAHPLFILLLSRGIGETPETEEVVTTDLQKSSGSQQNIYGAAECQYLIHIPTSALHKHRPYQTILNQRNTYDHRFILKPQAHKTFIISSVFFGSSTIQHPLGTTVVSPWHKQTQNIPATTRRNRQVKSLESPQLEARRCRNLICAHFLTSFFFFHLISVLELGPSDFHISKYKYTQAVCSTIKFLFSLAAAL